MYKYDPTLVNETISLDQTNDGILFNLRCMPLKDSTNNIMARKKKLIKENFINQKFRLIFRPKSKSQR